MAEVINMPRLSDTMEEGTVAKWLKQVGDMIEEGDILAESETDKATMEFESFNEGTLLHIGIKEGDTAPVDAFLAIIGEEGEDISGLLNPSSEPKEEKEKKGERPEQKETAEEKKSDAKTDAAAVPEGVEIVKMPRLSDTMEEGTVASWLKKVGDEVEEGDILAEIETDKATMEFESFYNGTLLYVGIEEGQSAPVDDVLAIIGPDGTHVEAVLASVKGGGSAAASSPKAEKVADKSQEQEKEEKPKESTDSNSAGGRIFASPLAKKIAEEKGIDLSQLKGSGENGRIVKKDVENYTPSAKDPEVKTDQASDIASAAAPFVPAGEEHVEEKKNSQMRKTIAKRLAESKYSAPHYYLTIEVDMSTAMASRSQINALPDIKVSFNDMVVKACAMALKKHPQVNTTWKDDVTQYNHHVHIGVAVAVDEGLLVPVLKFADQMSLTQIGGNVRELAGKARNKKITPQEMEGSTFTVSNLGM